MAGSRLWHTWENFWGCSGHWFDCKSRHLGGGMEGKDKKRKKRWHFLSKFSKWNFSLFISKWPFSHLMLAKIKRERVNGGIKGYKYNLRCFRVAKRLQHDLKGFFFPGNKKNLICMCVCIYVYSYLSVHQLLSSLLKSAWLMRPRFSGSPCGAPGELLWAAAAGPECFVVVVVLGGAVCCWGGLTACCVSLSSGAGKRAEPPLPSCSAASEMSAGRCHSCPRLWAMPV